MTLAQLLAHQAGLTVHGFPGHDLKGPVPTIYEVLDGKTPSFTPAVRSAFEPDLRFQYSGGGTSISQVLLTDVTRQAYDVWMYEQVLKPIGMVNSTYAQPPAKDIRYLCASAYRGDGTPVKRKFHVYPEQAAAGLWMTPSDLAQYIIDMQRAWKGEPSKVLTPEMVKLHLSPYNNGPTAMGTFVEDHAGAVYFGHGAGNDGFCGQFFGSLEGGYGVVIFLNSESGRLLGDVINSVAKAYNWENFYREPRRVTGIPMPEETLKSYEGLYVFDDTWAAIGQKDNTFHFYTGGTYAKMYFATPEQFVNEEFQAVKTMIKDEKGNVTGYKRTVNGQEYPAATKITRIDTMQLAPHLLAEISWYYIENKQYAASLAASRRGAELYPEEIMMRINMAHAYLYSGNYAEALTIYKANLSSVVRTGYSGADLLKDDYTYLRDNAHDVAVFDRVFKDLKIRKP
ncbi:MAG: class A beta-lactamase-related serine hydrolase [Bacteroidetes bacterium]|nr:MAG: class A beta-lactamase-related serine hydrolase [Bacteroidota bacterium]